MSKFNIEAKIKAALRKLSLQWPPISQVRRRAKAGPGMFRCENCQKIVGKVQINHKDPVVDPEQGFVSFDIYISRLFVSADDLEALCLDCHQEVTNEAREIRSQSTKKDA